MRNDRERLRIEVQDRRFKLEINLTQLSTLFKRIRAENLLIRTLCQIREEHFGVDERDWLVCRLVQRDDVSLEEVGACFGLSRQGIRQIAQRHHSAVVPKKSRWQRVQQRLEDLATDEGQKEVAAVMARAAREGSFWTTSEAGNRIGLIKRRVLQSLGFPEFRGHTYEAKTWHRLIADKIIEEWLLPGVVLRYGLEIENPAAFIRTHYHNVPGARIKDVTTIINNMAKEAGLLTICSSSLQYYAGKKGLLLKRKGQRSL